MKRARKLADTSITGPKLTTAVSTNRASDVPFPANAKSSEVCVNLFFSIHHFNFERHFYSRSNFKKNRDTVTPRIANGVS
jgi:hypothetical protein